MLEGVTIEKPETVTIDADVTDRNGYDYRAVCADYRADSDRRGLQNRRLLAFCMTLCWKMARRCFRFRWFRHRSWAANAHAGPYARLRMGAELGESAHVGNFVELKKTHFGAGSKSMHLAYLGDSQIGSKVNVGAGTITCNYDGQKKHQTVIGDGAFVGSNSTLVAPVEIGEGAYIAAGSVITEKVPRRRSGGGTRAPGDEEGWKSG